MEFFITILVGVLLLAALAGIIAGHKHNCPTCGKPMRCTPTPWGDEWKYDFCNPLHGG